MPNARFLPIELADLCEAAAVAVAAVTPPVAVEIIAVADAAAAAVLEWVSPARKLKL